MGQEVDPAAVDAVLGARSERRALVVTDSVVSVSGELAPLAELHAVCRQHGAVLLADEAHGLGVRGLGGRGLLAEEELNDVAQKIARSLPRKHRRAFEQAALSFRDSGLFDAERWRAGLIHTGHRQSTDHRRRTLRRRRSGRPRS